MTVYADVLFAVNFSMDFISLFICSLIMKRKNSKKRILISSAIGGAYGVFEVLVTMKPVLSAFVSVLVSFVMCFITYYEKNVKRFTAMYVMYWAVSATLGGVMSVLYGFFNKLLYENIKNHSFEKVYTGARFFVIASLAAIAAMLFGKIYSSKKDIKQAHVEVKIGNEIFNFDGLCDSGNMLTEPISGKSVILVSKTSDVGKAVAHIPIKYVRYIPYSAVGGDGVISGARPSSVKVDGSMVDAIIAPIDKRNFAGYEALVPASLL